MLWPGNKPSLETKCRNWPEKCLRMCLVVIQRKSHRNLTKREQRTSVTKFNVCQSKLDLETVN